MKMRIELRKRIFLNFILVITLFGILGALFGAALITRYTLQEAQTRVSLDLRSAWSVLQGELEKMRLAVRVLGTGQRVAQAFVKPTAMASRASLEAVRRECGFDFLSLTDRQGRVIVRSLEPYHSGDFLYNDPFVHRALNGQSIGGFDLLGPQRLQAEGANLEERAFIVFESTPKAKPRAKEYEPRGMALVAAAPVKNEQGALIGSLYAGILLNRNHALVDRIRSIVFENNKYNGRDLGTVTIFLWDCRIATNVVKANGNRAIGTRVSGDVYDRVLENNQHWYDRAFVVNDWYLSAYDPIHDIENKTIGILYVGVLAKRYDDLKQRLWHLSIAISCGVALFVMVVGLFFARRLSGPLSRLAEAAGRIARGDLNLNVPEPTTNDEILDLTRSFNAMALSLRDHDDKIRTANQELEQTNNSLQKLNRNYLDMLGFVSHELKNTLGVIYTSARALDRGMIGTLNESQAALVRNISRSIESAVMMTRNYLDMARIEQGELSVDIRKIDLAKEVVFPVLEELRSPISENAVTIENRLPEGVLISADPILLQIVYRNLLENAIKYGGPQRIIRLGFQNRKTEFEFEVWNQGAGLQPEEISRLFGKFVRMNHKTATSRSSGLGLFITKEIISKHGGSIRVASQPGEWINFIFTLPNR
jgi:two-component system NtrC family sensor kinase